MSSTSVRSDQKAVVARISGRVQGVWFRAWTKQEAERLGLRGWVRNRPDGSVEAMFVGAEAAVDEMLAACREGPPHAEVSDIQTQTPTGLVPNGFEVRGRG